MSISRDAGPDPGANVACTQRKNDKPVRKGSRVLGALASVFITDDKWENGYTILVYFDRFTANQRRIDLDTIKAYVSDSVPPMGIKLQFVDERKGAHVRVGFDEIGNWSYIGNRALTIREIDNTMNIQTVDRRTVVHEFGHMLGLHHEHLNRNRNFEYDEDKTIQYYAMPPNYWSEGQTRDNVLNIPDGDHGPYDDKSVMHYTICAKTLKTQNGNDCSSCTDCYGSKCPCHGIWSWDLSETFNADDVEILQKYYPVLEEEEEKEEEEEEKEKEEEEEEKIHPPSPQLDKMIIWSVVLGSVALSLGSMFAFLRLRKILAHARSLKRKY